LYRLSRTRVLPLAFLIYLVVLPTAFYRQHAIVVLALAGAALFLSFSIRPFAWAIAFALVLVGIQLVPHRVPHLIETSPVAVKTLAVVAFFYATLFSAGYDSARFETQFFVTDRDTRYALVSINDKDAFAVELLDADCKPVRSLPAKLEGYHFERHIRAFTLGDTDTPTFRLYETDGLTPSKDCAQRDSIRSKPFSIWLHIWI
jgi:hypothetical protein